VVVYSPTRLSPRTLIRNTGPYNPFRHTIRTLSRPIISQPEDDRYRRWVDESTWNGIGWTGWSNWPLRDGDAVSGRRSASSRNSAVATLKTGPPGKLPITPK
jgi:hypothetical protein